MKPRQEARSWRNLWCTYSVLRERHLVERETKRCGCVNIPRPVHILVGGDATRAGRPGNFELAPSSSTFQPTAEVSKAANFELRLSSSTFHPTKFQKFQRRVTFDSDRLNQQNWGFKNTEKGQEGGWLDDGPFLQHFKLEMKRKSLRYYDYYRKPFTNSWIQPLYIPHINCIGCVKNTQMCNFFQLERVKTPLHTV